MQPFESLNERCVACLDVLAYITPDSIPQDLFEVSDLLQMPESLAYSSDALQYVITKLSDQADAELCPRFSEVLETLLALALVKRDKTTRTLTLHRLAQTQFMYFC